MIAVITFEGPFSFASQVLVAAAFMVAMSLALLERRARGMSLLGGIVFMLLMAAWLVWNVVRLVTS